MSATYGFSLYGSNKYGGSATAGLFASNPSLATFLVTPLTTSTSAVPNGWGLGGWGLTAWGGGGSTSSGSAGQASSNPSFAGFASNPHLAVFA